MIWERDRQRAREKKTERKREREREIDRDRQREIMTDVGTYYSVDEPSLSTRFIASAHCDIERGGI